MAPGLADSLRGGLARSAAHGLVSAERFLEIVARVESPWLAGSRCSTGVPIRAAP
jgi:hypothetical protein